MITTQIIWLLMNVKREKSIHSPIAYLITNLINENK